MIRRPDALDARLVDAFLDYVQARGLFVDPARVRSPKDKPRVENQVPYVRELVRRRDVHVARRCPRERRALVARGRRRARARHHEAGSSRALRGSREADDEASAGRALRRPRLDRQGEGPPDHHIQVAHALYSVPTRYLRRHVRVRADRSTVKIYFGTELIKVHPRKPPGGCSTDVHDYPAEKAAYALRDVDAILRKARDKAITSVSTRSGSSADRCRGRGCARPTPCSASATSTRPAASRRSARARLAFDLVSVPRIARKLKAAAKPVMPCAAMGKVVQLPLPRFARPTQHFETRGTSSQKEGV
ncbi:MAG: hypothetical protein IPG04_40560 [Polyangiaceae bacterium]|nr:hypothetical protein [Polyangiaceae bacterium]